MRLLFSLLLDFHEIAILDHLKILLKRANDMAAEDVEDVEQNRPLRVLFTGGPGAGKNLCFSKDFSNFYFF